MKSILVIDDKNNNLITFRALISDYMPDCVVLTALSGSEGINIAQDRQPDTIIVDIVMPEMDGFETCKRLKENKLTKHIPVVFITAVQIDTKSRIDGLSIGADAILSKPIDPAELMAQINVMLRIKEVEDKLRAKNEMLETLVKERTLEISENNKKLEREIAVRKQTEVEIEKLSLRNKLLLETTLDGYILTESDGQIIDVNPAYCAMVGYSKEELLQMAIFDLDIEIQPEEMPSKIKELTLKGNSRTETRHKCKNGSILSLDISISIVQINGTQMIGAFIRDITKKRYAEQIQKVLFNISNASMTTDNLIKLITQIKEYLGVVIDTKNFYIALYDSETDTLSLPFFEDEKDRITAIPAGKTLTSYVIKTEKPLLATKEKLNELENAGEVGKFGTDSEIWLGVPLKIKGKVTGVLAVQSYTDEHAYDEKDLELLEFISEQISISLNRKNAEQELKDALEKARESDRLKSVFLTTMSHELRTPLNAVIGFSDIIRNEDLSIDDIMAFNKSINISGNNLLNIVEDIFEITLIETGELKIIKENVKLLDMLNDVNEVVLIEQKNTGKENVDLKFKILPKAENIIIETDSSKFKQILINLLKNAFKFTHQGYVECGCSIIHDGKNPMLKFYVKDTGIGIPKKKKELIFEMFRQVEETHSRRYGGAGIGLAIAKKLTEHLGGKIWLDSGKHKGSIFYFTIPYITGSNNNITDKAEALIETGIRNKHKVKTVLIVEDDNQSSNFLHVILEKLVPNCVWALDGEEAVRLCKENDDIGLVLMDLNMPVMNGYEATRRIKETRPSLPIIAQTAYAIEGDREKAIEVGCDDYITKPIKKAKLLAMIEKYLDN